MQYKYSGAEWMYQQIDAELFPPFDEFNKAAGDLVPLSAPERRAIQARFNPVEPAWVKDALDVRDVTIDGLDGDPQLTVRVYVPRNDGANAAVGKKRPGLLCIHGGGMWTGSIDSEHAKFAEYARDLDAVVVSVDYRLAPEHPYPAGLRDCFAALQWFASQVEELGVDPERFALYGGSSGGGLTVSLALYSRDHNGPKISYMMALYPMIDDTNTTASSYQIDGTGAGAWDRRDNIEGWRWYLAEHVPDIYAAPARASIEELEGLPPTYMDVGNLDVFRDEDLALASKLCTAGIPVEMHLMPRMFHGGENVVPTAGVSQRMWSYRMDSLHRHLDPQ